MPALRDRRRQPRPRGPAAWWPGVLDHRVLRRGEDGEESRHALADPEDGPSCLLHTRLEEIRVIVIVVKFPVRPERMEEWTSLAREYAAAVDAEEGSVFFEWSRSLEDPDTFVCVEGFRDAAAGGSHVGTGHFKRFVDVAPDLVSAQPQIIYIDAPDVSGFGPMGEIQPRG